MADKEKSRADDLFEILNDFSDSPEKDLSIAESKDKKSASGENDAYVDELIGILSDNGAEEAEAEPACAGCGIDCEDEIPDSIFAHLSDGAADRTAPVTGEKDSHFTEDFTAISQEEAEKAKKSKKSKKHGEDYDEDNEDEKPIKKAKRILSGLSIIPKALIYIALVVIVSVCLAFNLITVVNDIFAFVTDSGEVTVTIPEGADDKEVAKILEKEGIIEHSFVYELYMKTRGDGDAETEYIPGDHKLDLSYNYSQIITALTTNSRARTVERITIPEGQTVDEIIDALVAKGIGTREGYVEAINNYPYKWEFVKLLDEKGYSEHRKYRLEGYLYPDTYEFYTDTSEVYIINKMLAAFNEKFWEDFTRKNSGGKSYQDTVMEEYGMDFDDIIVLASMVQSEGKVVDDFYSISYVFHNRLSHAKQFPYLQSDATLQYALAERIQDPGELRQELENNENPYNSYKHKGLPPGAISNPGTDALYAAIFPSMPLSSSGKEINAYYFVSNDAGKTYFSSTESGHNNNRAQVEKDNKAIEAGTYEG